MRLSLKMDIFSLKIDVAGFSKHFQVLNRSVHIEVSGLFLDVLGCWEFQLTKTLAIMHQKPWSRKHDDGNKFGELAGKKWLRALQPKIGPPFGSIFIAHCDVSLVLAKISCFWYWQNGRDHMCGTALSFSFLLIVARALGVRQPRHPLFWPRSSRKCLVSSRGCWSLPTNIAACFCI